MVQMMQIVTANASAFLLLAIIKIHMERQFKVDQLLDVRILSLMMSLTMFQCIFDTLVFWIDGKDFPGAIALNYVGNILYYTFNMMIAYFWPLFVEYRLYGKKDRVKRLSFVLGIPLAVMAFFVLMTPVNGFIFTISEENRYVRTGYTFFLPTIMIISYLLYGMGKIYASRKKEGKYMLFPAVYFVTPVLLGVFVQAMQYGISLIFIGIAIGLTGVYLSTQNDSIYMDSLCSVFNRRYYTDYVRAFCNSGKKQDRLTGALLDMDNFKPINDACGHDTGDKALKLFASILRKRMQDSGFVVRYGGDEFILLTKKPESEVQEMIQAVTQELEAVNASGTYPFALAFSYGIASISVHGNSDAFLSAMDKRMYEMKREKKVDR